jgi:hypothetical protein
MLTWLGIDHCGGGESKRNSGVWLKYPNADKYVMSSVLSLISILALIVITIIHLNMVMIHAEDSSLPYCATGEGKDGISVKICSVDKEKCDKNVKENEIFASCNENH